MRTALLVAAHEIRLRLRDRSVIILGFIAPFALAAIIGSRRLGARARHAEKCATASRQTQKN